MLWLSQQLVNGAREIVVDFDIIQAFTVGFGSRSMTRANEDWSGSDGPCSSDVAQAIANHGRVSQCHVEAFADIDEHAWRRFSAGTTIVRAMRAEENSLYMPAE